MMRSFRMVTVVVALFSALGVVPPVRTEAAFAQSLAGFSQECGTYRWDGDLVKGRTDSMIVRVDHTEGCFRYVAWTHIGADRDEMASDPVRERRWQQSACLNAGRQMIHGHFKFYRGLDIDAKNVDGSISCEPWAGGD